MTTLLTLTLLFAALLVAPAPQLDLTLVPSVASAQSGDTFSYTLLMATDTALAFHAAIEVDPALEVTALESECGILEPQLVSCQVSMAQGRLSMPLFRVRVRAGPHCTRAFVAVARTPWPLVIAHVRVRNAMRDCSCKVWLPVVMA
jgi:hypothetical protein